MQSDSDDGNRKPRGDKKEGQWKKPKIIIKLREGGRKTNEKTKLSSFCDE